MKFDVSAKGGYGMFSVSAEASYLREIEEKTYTLSLNYYQYAHNTVSISVNGFGLEALTESAKSFYQDGKNPYFGIICGDYYISQYDQGALLLMNLSIELNSKYQKEQFKASSGGSFGDIFSASAKIETLAKSLKLTGSVSIQAFQIGGDPTQLGKILSKDTSGNYYILRCSIDNMASCKQAADGILDYANSKFSTQFNFDTNTGLTPLGSGFTIKQPIYYIGLAPPKFLVDQTVIDARNKLSSALSQSKYYRDNLFSLLYGYAAKWQIQSSIYQAASKLYNQINENIDKIFNYSDALESALGCFYYPDKCVAISEKIYDKLKIVVADDLKFMKDVRYIVPTYGGNYYRIGDGDNARQGISIGNVYQKFYVTISANKYSFHTNAWIPDLFDFIYNGTLQPDRLTYF